MKYTIEKKENGVFEAKVSVEKQDWDKALNSAYEKNKGK